MKGSQIAQAMTLLQQLSVLESRLTQVTTASSASDLFNLLNGVAPLTGVALTTAQGQVTAYLQNAIQMVQQMLTNIGVDYTQ